MLIARTLWATLHALKTILELIHFDLSFICLLVAYVGVFIQLGTQWGLFGAKLLEHLKTNKKALMH